MAERTVTVKRPETLQAAPVAGTLVPAFGTRGEAGSIPRPGLSPSVLSPQQRWAMARTRYYQRHAREPGRKDDLSETATACVKRPPPNHLARPQELHYSLFFMLYILLQYLYIIQHHVVLYS